MGAVEATFEESQVYETIERIEQCLCCRKCKENTLKVLFFCICGGAIKLRCRKCGVEFFG